MAIAYRPWWPEWPVELSPDAASRGMPYRVAKRCMDLLIGVPALILLGTLIVTLLTALLGAST